MQAVAIATSNRPSTAPSRREEVHSYWVPVPDSRNADDLRVLLLTMHFGFTHDAADAFAKVTDFVIKDTNTNKKATFTDIAKWKRDPHGQVEITVGQAWVDKIKAFNGDHVKRLLSRAAASITDPKLRQAFIDEMQKILAGDGSDRPSAFGTLLNNMAASDASPASVTAAFKALEDAGYDQDPFIALAKTSLALREYQTQVGPGFELKVTEGIRETMRRLRDRQSIADPDDVLSGADVAVINQALARIHADMGDDDAANRREWIARFAAMTPEERAGLAEGSLVELQAPNTTSVRRPDSYEYRRNDIAADWARKQEMERAIDDIGSPKPRNADRVDAFNGDLDEGTTRVGVESTKNRAAKRNGKRPYKPKYKITARTTTVRSQPRIRAVKGGAGALDLVLLVLKFGAADRRMRELAEYTRQRDSIVDKIERRRRRFVPPKPATICSQIDALVKLDTRGYDTRQKQAVTGALEELRRVLEESRAAWPNQ